MFPCLILKQLSLKRTVTLLYRRKLCVCLPGVFHPVPLLLSSFVYEFVITFSRFLTARRVGCVIRADYGLRGANEHCRSSARRADGHDSCALGNNGIVKRLHCAKGSLLHEHPRQLRGEGGLLTRHSWCHCLHVYFWKCQFAFCPRRLETVLCFLFGGV